MKKKLEAELISIAHRVLKMKNRAGLEQLQQETLRLYEKLSVLKFVEDNLSDVKPTIGFAAASEKIEQAYEAADNEEEPEVMQPELVNEVTEDEIEESEAKEAPVAEAEEEDNKSEDKVDAVTQAETPEPAAEPEPKPEAVAEAPEPETPKQEEIKPVGESPFGFDIDFEPKEPTEIPEKQKEISFEDFHDYVEPEFVKKDTDAPAPAEVKATEESWHNWEPKKEEPEPEVATEAESEPFVPVQTSQSETAKRSLNDSLGKAINLGLNDRIAFEKHLFDGNSDDLNRVLSQLNTFDKFTDARNFINELVKPDYNNWKDKEEYEERFMGIVEQKFD
ncbi:hypothetical protein [Flavobacterium litorale]|uniref:Uncharacterized protein n=1 Tax=Flavobacterium litorale TaxID=2856519 RepID=A0ABX8V7D0_9FLAO|nr:hypothetical protein [Flavobacterium litorale]QYJ68752.1 hypothetical protein K1I41_02405 [Flavobacterium litorale]